MTPTERANLEELGASVASDRGRDAAVAALTPDAVEEIRRIHLYPAHLGQGMICRECRWIATLDAARSGSIDRAIVEKALGLSERGQHFSARQVLRDALVARQEEAT